jgi:hypothetical protein
MELLKEILWDASEKAYNDICRIYGRRVPLPENNVLNIKANGHYVNIKVGQVLTYNEKAGIVNIKNLIV